MDREPSTILEMDRISKRFGGVVALDQVSLKVHEHEILALIGPNGAGKTTLLNIIAGTLAADEGQVRFRDKRLDGRPTHERVRMGLGRTFQQAFVFREMTVLENVMVGCHIRGQCEALDAALRLGAARREEEDIYLDALRYLNMVGLGGKADERAGDRPFGQQRLLAIARTLALDPTVALLDEPGAGLNRLEKNDLVDLIRRMQQMGVTIILVEHDMELVMQLADWVVVLNHGKRLAQGVPADVRHNRAVIEAYLGVEEG
ncbi:MAG: ABC transporter ATP-binding protein [Chloroflexota bacterium]